MPYKDPEKSRLYQKDYQRKWRKSLEGEKLEEYKRKDRESSSKWRLENREKHLENSRKWYEENRELAIARRTKNYKENCERERQARKKWAAENPEKIRIAMRKQYLKNRERILANNKRWSLANPQASQAYSTNRRARKLQASGSFTKDQFIDLCEQYEQLCAYCGKKDKLTVDHIVPLSRGGSNYIENIAPACGKCNARKYTKTGEEFLALLDRESAM